MHSSRSASRSGVSKAQAARDVDHALGVVRTPRHMPMVEGFNSEGSRFAIRVAFHFRYHGQVPEGAAIAALRPSRLKLGDGVAVLQRVHQVAEQAGWIAGAPLTCTGCGSRDVTLSWETQPYRGCWSCGLFFGEMTEDTEDELRARGYSKFSVTRPGAS